MRHRALTTNVRVFVLNRDAAGRVRVLRAPEHRGSYGDLATSRDRRRVRWRAWRAARVVILRTRRSWFSELANPRTFLARSFAVRLWASAFAFAPSSAPDLDNGAVSPRVRVVHPFHPWSGREFELGRLALSGQLYLRYFMLRAAGSGTRRGLLAESCNRVPSGDACNYSGSRCTGQCPPVLSFASGTRSGAPARPSPPR